MLNRIKKLTILAIAFPGIFGEMGALQAQINTTVTPGTNPVESRAENVLNNKNKDEKSQETQGLQNFDAVIKNTEKLEGLFTIYRHKENGKIYLEIKPEQLNKNYLAIITMNSGIGQGLIRGLPLQDFLFSLRRVNQTVQFVVTNTYFRVNREDPRSRSVDTSFSDSVLEAVAIKSIHPQRKTILIELNELFLADIPNFKLILDNYYRLDKNQTYFRNIKAFPLNVEIETIYGFTQNESNQIELSSLPDNRSFNLSVRYSLSELPVNNGYRPRIADERIGYFITAYQDFSNDNNKEKFVRYINRWHLEKKDANAPLSPPKQPIVFWLENTIPIEYRSVIREGILMWNKAFEKAGFINAIEVKQMPDNATWDPADVRYNVIRWSYSFQNGFLGIGPSRVNPLTGQILDADIIIDGNSIQFIRNKYRNLISPRQPKGISFLSKMTETYCNPLGLQEVMIDNSLNLFNEKRSANKLSSIPPSLAKLIAAGDLCFGIGSINQAAFGAMTLSLVRGVSADSQEMQEYVNQYLRELIAHEVGHTLGLRHNFHGSTFLKPEELNNIDITRSKGLTGSIMDYNPVNLAPPGVKQGDYFTRVVGPYDEWAIEYGYKQFPTVNKQSELNLLKSIAQRSSEPGLAYATDEDTMDFLDPNINIFDMSSDTITYSQWQMENAREIWLRLTQNYPEVGESYSEMRDFFDAALFHYFIHAIYVTKYIGGQYFNRDRAGESNGRLPFEIVPLAKQKEALAVLNKYVFDENAFKFSPDLVNKLAPSRWNHWGEEPPIFSLDYPIGDRISLLQRFLLRIIMRPNRLTRLRDIELRSTPGTALTLPDFLETVQQGIWKEVLEDNNKNQQISGFRRAIQREHLEILINMVLRQSNAPEDARTLARYELRQLHKAVDRKLRREGKNLDTYTNAHLDDIRDRIVKTLDAQLNSN